MESNDYFIPLLMRHLQLLDINCKPQELQLVLQSSPSFPSVLSIVQAYTYFRLKATAYRADYAALEKITIPVVAHIKQGDTGRFILIYAVSATRVIYYDAFINETIEVPKNQFCTIWTGIIVLSEKAENIYQSKREDKHSTYIALFGVICLALLFFMISPASQEEYALEDIPFLLTDLSILLKPAI